LPPRAENGLLRSVHRSQNNEFSGVGNFKVKLSPAIHCLYLDHIARKC